MKIKYLSIFLAFFASSIWAECFYQLDQESLNIAWTAYKTTEKVPVGGVFQKSDIQAPKSASSLELLLKDIKVSPDVKSLETKDASRNMKILTFFFRKMDEALKISGEVVSVEKNKKVAQEGVRKGTLQLKIKMNGQESILPMSWSYGPKNLFVADGHLDITNDFKAAGALKSLHNACKVLHAGKDGLSKTWTDVALKLSAKVVEVCK